MHFNSFPDDCILLIFTRLPLQTLVQIKIVCHKWKLLQSLAYRGRHSLILLVGDKALDLKLIYDFGKNNNMLELLNGHDNQPMFVSPIKMAKLHGLKLNNLTEQKCDWLVQKFANIRSLHISISDHDEKMSKPATVLFTAWAARLSTLKLYLPDYPYASDYLSLFEQINIRLLALRNLTLYICQFLSHTFEHLPIQPLDTKIHRLDMPVLSRLNRFYFAAFDKPDIILDSLVRYGQPNQNLKQIRLKNVGLSDKRLSRKFRKLSPDLTHRFTGLLQSVKLSDLPLVELQALFRQFPNQQLEISFCYEQILQMSYSVADLFNSLSLLKNLIKFHFHMNTNIPDNVQLNCSLPHLNSILMLTLSGIKSHTLLSQLNIAWIFPNIQILVLHTRSIVDDYLGLCDKCSENCVKENEEIQFRACLRLLLGPLKQCTKLRKIDFKRPELFNIDDIVQECLRR